MYFATVDSDIWIPSIFNSPWILGKIDEAKETDAVKQSEADKKTPINPRQGGKKVPLGPGNFWNNMLSTVLLLIFVTAVFSYITENKVEPEEGFYDVDIVV